MHCSVNGQTVELGYKVWKDGRYHQDCAAQVLRGTTRRKKDKYGRYIMTEEEFMDAFRRLNAEATLRNKENNGLDIMSVAYRGKIPSENC